jgi:short-subunit dehydrogenase
MTTLADDIAGNGRPRPLVIALDLAASDACMKVDAALAAHNVEPQYVVNNAGFGLFGRAAELDRAEQLAMIDLNVRTLTDFSLRWIDTLARHKGGILNVASVGSFLPGPHMAIYYATKAYVLSFSEALHRECKRRDVRVTALCPGPVMTEFHARAGIAAEKFPRRLALPASRVAEAGYRGLMAGRRLVAPGLFTKIATFLPRLAPRFLVLEAVNASQRHRGKPSSTPGS